MLCGFSGREPFHLSSVEVLFGIAVVWRSRPRLKAYEFCGVVRLLPNAKGREVFGPTHIEFVRITFGIKRNAVVVLGKYQRVVFIYLLFADVVFSAL